MPLYTRALPIASQDMSKASPRYANRALFRRNLRGPSKSSLVTVNGTLQQTRRTPYQFPRIGIADR